MKQDEAEIVAIMALEWIAGNDDLFMNFLNITGESAEGIRHRLAEPEFLAAVMDHLLSSDEAVQSFCAENRITPETPMEARRALPGGDAPEWT